MKEILISSIIADLTILTKDIGRNFTEEFYVERHFLKDHLNDDVARIMITMGGISKIRFDDVEFDCFGVTIAGFSTGSVGPNQHFTFLYYGGKGGHTGPRHGLTIYDERENMLYWRDIGQDPKKEWNINSMAGDLVDANGHHVFDGDPVQC